MVSIKFVIDSNIQVLEEIRIGLESNDYGMQQRRIAHMRFLGELYNYEHVDSSVIFETLYLILVFGRGTPEVWNAQFFLLSLIWSFWAQVMVLKPIAKPMCLYYAGMKSNFCFSLHGALPLSLPFLSWIIFEFCSDGK